MHRSTTAISITSLGESDAQIYVNDEYKIQKLSYVHY